MNEKAERGPIANTPKTKPVLVRFSPIQIGDRRSGAAKCGRPPVGDFSADREG